MPDTSLKDQIKKIVELQKIDGQIYNFKIDLKDKPAVIEQLRIEFEAHKGVLKDLEEKLKSVQVDRKEKELELKTQEDEISKFNSQLSQIKTNKEYTAKLAEIEHVKADQSVFEEKVLLSYDESDKIKVEIEKEKQKVSEEERDYLAKKKKTEDDINLIEDRIKVLESQHAQAVPGIDSEYLDRYERILKHKNGLAIVPVEENVCSGCFMNVTSQQVNLIKMNMEIIECGACTRILYLEDVL